MQKHWSARHVAVRRQCMPCSLLSPGQSLLPAVQVCLWLLIARFPACFVFGQCSSLQSVVCCPAELLLYGFVPSVPAGYCAWDWPGKPPDPGLAEQGTGAQLVHNTSALSQLGANHLPQRQLHDRCVSVARCRRSSRAYCQGAACYSSDRINKFCCHASVLLLPGAACLVG